MVLPCHDAAELDLIAAAGWQQQGSRAVVACPGPGTATIPRCRYDDSSEAALSGRQLPGQQQGSRAAARATARVPRRGRAGWPTTTRVPRCCQGDSKGPTPRKSGVANDNKGPTLLPGRQQGPHAAEERGGQRQRGSHAAARAQRHGRVLASCAGHDAAKFFDHAVTCVWCARPVGPSMSSAPTRTDQRWSQRSRRAQPGGPGTHSAGLLHDVARGRTEHGQLAEDGERVAGPVHRGKLSRAAPTHPPAE